MKKLILLIVLISGISNIGVCQQRIVKKRFQVKKDEEVSLHLKFGDSIMVKSWPKNAVAFKAMIEINRGKLNDALELHFKNQNGQLQIVSDFNNEKLKAGRASDCPGHQYSRFNTNGNGESYAVCAEITYTVFVPAQVNLNVKSIDSDIELVHLKGPIHAKTISGGIKMDHLAGPIRAKSISGFVDLSWLPETAARFALKTTSGQTYTNLDDLKISNNHVSIVGQDIKATFGDGGPRVSLKSISGNIYLRKEKSR